MNVHVRVVDEPWPAESWTAFFSRAWPLYRAWFLSEGVAMRADRHTSRLQLEIHMPELLPVYDAFVSLAGDDDVAASFLSLWCPPPYMAGCSLAASGGAHPTLVRNYDFDPRYFDGRVTRTAFCKRVVGMQDSAWGLLDGINEDGLTLALAFGGRKVSGVGFGIPIVLRYVLETCATTAEACAVMARLPVHMSYTVMAVDRSGAVGTVYLNPDRPAETVQHSVATNHQRAVEWDAHAALTRTVERRLTLETAMAAAFGNPAALLKSFLRSPLYSQRYFDGFGTLYTAAYDTHRGAVQYVWPEKRIEVGVEHFEEQEVRVTLLRPVGRYLAK